MWKRLRSCFICGRSSDNRSGSPDKLTNVSSSGESEAPERFGNNGKQESNDKNLGVKKNAEEAFGQKNEGAQLIQNEENEGNENLRHRLSVKKPKPQDTEGETKANSTTSNTSNNLQDNSVEEIQEIETPCTKDVNLGESLQACETKEVKQQENEIEIKPNTFCNVEVSDEAPGNSTIRTIFDRIQDEGEAKENIEERFTREHNPDSLREVGNTQEEAKINNAIDTANEPLTDDSNTLQNATKQDVLVEEPQINISQANCSESAFELQEESSFSLHGRESFKQQQNIAGELSNDLNLEVIAADECTQPLGVVEINYPPAQNDNVEHFVVDSIDIEKCHDSVEENEEITDDNKNVNFMPNKQHDILDSDLPDLRPDNVVEKFSKRLSKCVIDAVLQDTQLLFSQSEEDNDKHQNKESILKFSDILAESIVKSVIEYSKVSQDQISEHDEHDRLSPNVADVRNKPNENINLDVPDESSPTNEEEIFSADEANDDTCAGNLHEYAKKLSQQIVCDVLDFAGDSTKCSSTDAYASKLTKSVLSNAINGAKTRIGDTNSLADSDLGADGALDLFIVEIVGNAIESAISRMGRQACRDAEEYSEMESDLVEQDEEYGENHMDRGGQLGRFNGQDVEEYGGENEDTLRSKSGHLGTCNGEIDTANARIGHDENEPEQDSGTQPVQQNGKLQSKWLNEDDLDELYDGDLSDKEASASVESSKSVLNSKNDNQGVATANHLTTPDDKKEFWRKSLIDDLDHDDGDLDIDEIETPRSSLFSTPSKPSNIEDIMVDGSGEDSDDEVLETSKSAKVQAPIGKTTDSSRSRLRSVDTSPVLVLDNGSAYLKVGFSDQALPKEIVSSVVGTPLRYSQDIAGMEYNAKPGSVFGYEAMCKAGVMHIEYPLKPDLVERWSDVEGLWNYVFSSLMCIQDNPDFPILISQSALNPKKNTEKFAEIMFEHFHMPSLFIADQLALSLFAMGYTSGLSFSSGFKSTQAGVVYEGHLLPFSVKQLDIAGYQLTENLKKLLMSLKGFGFRSSSQWQIVDDIKKKMGFFSLDFEADSNRYKTDADLQTTYELPDGQVIEIGLERFGCAESMFRPMEVGLTQSPAHMLIIEAINSCEEELQEICYKAMGVSGGTTEMTGCIERLEQELREHDRKFKNLTIPERRDISTWLGGAVVASLPTFREMVVTVDEYAESGARVVHSKCF